jgi:hypothetical protein
MKKGGAIPLTPRHKALVRKPIRTAADSIKLMRAIFWDACNGLITETEIEAAIWHANPPSLRAKLDDFLATPEGQAAVNDMIAGINREHFPSNSRLRKFLDERFPSR